MMATIIHLPNATLGEYERQQRPLFCQNLLCRCPLEWPEHGVEMRVQSMDTQLISVFHYTLCVDCFDAFDERSQTRVVNHSPVTAENCGKRGQADDR